VILQKGGLLANEIHMKKYIVKIEEVLPVVGQDEFKYPRKESIFEQTIQIEEGTDIIENINKAINNL